MRGPRKDPVRDNRIHEEAIVDDGPEEQAMASYYYLEYKISFPFKARCTVSKITPPLAKGEAVEVLRMAPEDARMKGILVLVRCRGQKLAVPLSQLTAVAPDDGTEAATGDW